LVEALNRERLISVAEIAVAEPIDKAFTDPREGGVSGYLLGLPALAQLLGPRRERVEHLASVIQFRFQLVPLGFEGRDLGLQFLDRGGVRRAG